MKLGIKREIKTYSFAGLFAASAPASRPRSDRDDADASQTNHVVCLSSLLAGFRGASSGRPHPYVRLPRREGHCCGCLMVHGRGTRCRCRFRYNTPGDGDGTGRRTQKTRVSTGGVKSRSVTRPHLQTTMMVGTLPGHNYCVSRSRLRGTACAKLDDVVPSLRTVAVGSRRRYRNTAEGAPLPGKGGGEAKAGRSAGIASPYTAVARVRVRGPKPRQSPTSEACCGAWTAGVVAALPPKTRFRLQTDRRLSGAVMKLRTWCWRCRRCSYRWVICSARLSGDTACFDILWAPG